ncbi:hypothetical protein QOT17_007233 [Balamuthia mandrillaris]
MTCAPKNVLGGCCGWFTFAFLLLALVFPWYVFTVSMKEKATGEDCAQATVFFWSTITCRDNPEDCSHQCDAVSTSNFWSKDEAPFKDLTPVFATSFFLILFSTLVSLFVAVLFSVRCCCMQEPTVTPTALNITATVLGVLSLLLLTISIIYFAAGLPKAFAKSHDGPSSEEGPWKTFIGAHTFDGMDEKDTFAWAPAGWWFALLGWPFLLGTIVTLATTLRATRYEDGYAMLPPAKQM